MPVRVEAIRNIAWNQVLSDVLDLWKDGIGSWGDVDTTEFARVDLAALNAVMASYLIALGAMNAVRPTGLLDEFKARILIGELSLEVLYRVLFHATHGIQERYVMSRDSYQW